MRFQLLTTLLAFVFLGILVLSSGCNKVPVTSLVRLARVDFDTTDLSSVRAAIRLPQDLRPLPGTGRLALARMRQNEPAENHVFTLREIEDPEAVLLNEETHNGMRVYAYALPGDAVRTLERLRAEALAARASGKGGSKLTLSIAAKACHLGPAPSGPLPVTTYLKTEETKSFVPLVRNIDLRSLADGKPLDIGPCPSSVQGG